MSKMISPGSRWKPYPWHTLDRLGRDEVLALQGFRRWAASTARLERMQAILEEWAGAKVQVRVRSTRPAAVDSPIADGVTLSISTAGEGPGEGARVELEAALAAHLVARALRRPPPVVIKPAAVTETVAGAAAAVVAALLRRSHAGQAVDVRVADGSAAAGGDSVAVTLTVVVGDEAFRARVIAPRAALPAGRPVGHWSKGRLAGLGATPLSVPVVACRATLSIAEAGALGPGDVLVLPPDVLPADGSGRVALCAPASDLGAAADLVEGRRLVLRPGREHLGMTEERMVDEGGGGALIESIGDVPVVVRVEIGEATLPARDWASLAPGDVVTLGRRVGEHVLLRIGGVPVARGELVDVEGEVGVRVVARLAEETATG